MRIFERFFTDTVKNNDCPMSILTTLIKFVFGSKADKDRKEIEPYLLKIKEVYPSIEQLSNDALRAVSNTQLTLPTILG